MECAPPSSFVRRMRHARSAMAAGAEQHAPAAAPSEVDTEVALYITDTAGVTRSEHTAQVGKMGDADEASVMAHALASVCESALATGDVSSEPHAKRRRKNGQVNRPTRRTQDDRAGTADTAKDS